MSRAATALSVVLLAAALAPTALAIPLPAVIEQLQTGRVALTNAQLAQPSVDAEALELSSEVPGCLITRRLFGSRICTQYTAAPPADTPAGRQALAVSDDDRYFTNPNGTGLSTLRFDLLVASPLDPLATLRLDAEVAQASPGMPIVAYALNHTTGRYDVVGTRSGREDGILSGRLGPAYTDDDRRLTLIFVNGQRGTAGTGFYVDTFGFDFDGIVPEPSSALLTGFGLVGLAVARRARC